jgi:hypothetical protein
LYGFDGRIQSLLGGIEAAKQLIIEAERAIPGSLELRQPPR